MSTFCRSCGAEIFWAITTSGRRKTIPLDNQPNPAGNVVIEDSRARVLNADQRAEAATAGVTLYMPHFATCPNAQAHRRPAPPHGAGPARPL